MKLKRPQSHTPGAWVAVELIPDQWVIASQKTGEIVARVDPGSPCRFENAVLLATAPSMALGIESSAYLFQAIRAGKPLPDGLLDRHARLCLGLVKATRGDVSELENLMHSDALQGKDGRG